MNLNTMTLKPLHAKYLRFPFEKPPLMSCYFEQRMHVRENELFGWTSREDLDVFLRRGHLRRIVKLYLQHMNMNPHSSIQCHSWIDFLKTWQNSSIFNSLNMSVGRNSSLLFNSIYSCAHPIPNKVLSLSHKIHYWEAINYFLHYFCKTNCNDSVIPTSVFMAQSVLYL